MVIQVEHEYNKLGIDRLVYSYETGGNRLTRVTDSAPTATRSQGFLDGNTTGNDYSYDLNGNITVDRNKGIDKIEYNYLNLPRKILGGSQTIEYIYSAGGQKLQKKAPNNEITCYSGNFIYEGTSLKQVLHGEGYIDMSGTPTYHYYLKDHLGNNRMVVNQSGTVVQQTDYYPFGMTFNKGGSSDNKYLYNGKELQEDAIGNGMLDWLDYGARMYDAELGRWFVVDPLAEKYYTYSLYAFTSNNPIINLEIDGQWYVKVHAYNDRAKYGYAVMRVYDKHSSLLREYTVRVQGMKHVKNNNNPRNRTLTYGDTPTGKYRIIGFSDRLPKTDEDVYGPNPVLELDYIEGEAAGQRNGMHAHGGRQKNNPKNPKGTLWNTGGCMRMKDDDILDFYNTISNLETDDIEEEGTFLTVENDLKSEDGEYNPPERDSNYKQDDDNQSSINYWSMFIRNLLLYNSNSK